MAGHARADHPPNAYCEWLRDLGFRCTGRVLAGETLTESIVYEVPTSEVPNLLGVMDLINSDFYYQL